MLWNEVRNIAHAESYEQEMRKLGVLCERIGSRGVGLEKKLNTSYRSKSIMFFKGVGVILEGVGSLSK